MDSWGWSAAQRLRWIEQCLELQISSFDHADIYGDYRVQGLFGEALALQPGLRKRLQLVGKCGIRLLSSARPAHRVKSYDTSAAHIIASVEQSLRELRTDRLDLLLIHRPDPLMEAQEVAQAVHALQRAGKVLHFGVSNFTPAQFELLHAALPLATNQIELHPLHREPLHDGTLDQLQRLQRRPMIWSPLAGGRLLHGEDEAAWRVRHALQSVAQRLQRDPAVIALAWVLRHPSRPVPVTGSREVGKLQQATEALSFRLSAEDWAALWQAGAGHELP
ncbi:MAG: aldo/keto reductase [Rubrivivax sp.]|nr:aldo/keto reductase [Rubrivivax sp.]